MPETSPIRPAVPPARTIVVFLNPMFDIGWSELIILGVIALIIVGPKDLPVLLRTIGRYVGIIRRQASEFRTQFDEALRETEIDQIRKDMAGIKNDVSSTMQEAGRSVERDIDKARMESSAKAALEPKADGKPAAVAAAAGTVAAPSAAIAPVSAGVAHDADADADDWVQATYDDPGPPRKAEAMAKEPQRHANGSAEKSGV